MRKHINFRLSDAEQTRQAILERFPRLPEVRIFAIGAVAILETKERQEMKIMTDTSANLPAELIERYDLRVIPFSYTLDGQEHIPQDDFNGKAFYDAMRAGASVQTSMVSPGAFLAAMEESLEAGQDVLYIGMSGGISGTVQAAEFAARELRETYPQRRIAVVNTLAASLGEGLQVLRAARLRDEGATLDTIVETLEEEKHRVCQYFTVDDLEYLKRGGRLSRVATVIGTILKIKPILTGDKEGKIVLCGKTRGKKQALAELAQRYQHLCADKTAPVGIAHADDAQGAALLLAALKEAGLQGQCLTVCYEPVTGAHVGPGTVALFFYGTHK